MKKNESEEVFVRCECLELGAITLVEDYLDLFPSDKNI
jgi:hypothetical protein